MKSFNLLKNTVTESDVKKICNAIKHPTKGSAKGSKFGTFIKRNG